MSRDVTQCDQCGQVDDHPKAHVGTLAGDVATKHHDCLSVGEKEFISGAAQPEGSVKASAVIRACVEDGLHGDELLAFIAGGHAKSDLAVGALHDAAPPGPLEPQEV